MRRKATRKKIHAPFLPSNVKVNADMGDQKHLCPVWQATHKSPWQSVLNYGIYCCQQGNEHACDD